MRAMAEYDVFISYKSEQRSWAERLAADLRRLRYRVFRDHDQDGLQASDVDFRNQLEAANVGSSQFVVLWSGEVANDSYVLREISDRRTVDAAAKLLLLDESRTLASLLPGAHHFRGFLRFHTEHGRDGGHRVPIGEWNRTVREFAAQALYDGDNRVRQSPEVPFAFVAMTADQAAQLNRGEAPSLAGNVQSEVLAISTPTGEVDITRYGEVPADWKPFDADVSVQAMLDGFDEARRNHLPLEDPRLLQRWPWLVSYTDCVLEPRGRRPDFDRMMERASLIIIDTISLLHAEVLGVVNRLQSNTKACLLMVGPVYPALHTGMAGFSSVEEGFFTGLQLDLPYEKSNEDFYPPIAAPILNIASRRELARWVHVLADQIATWEVERASSIHVGHGEAVRSGPPHTPRMRP